MGLRRGMFLLCGVVLLVLSLTLSGFTADSKVLRVGSDCAYPPMEMQNEKTGEFEGFDIDLIKAIAKRMGRMVQIVNTGWDGIIPGLLNGNYDCLISAMTITDERQAQINFSDPYFAAGQVIMVRADNNTIKGPADLKGKKVGVQIGTTGDIAVSKMAGVTVVRFNLNPEAVLELKNGGVDAVVADNTTLMWEALKDKKLKLADRKPFTVEYYGIGVKKGNDALLNQINKALAAIKADGEYDKIMEKWFGN
ncbi:MAG: basic amino acid ABC transporter substrate-binding protein [Bacteroidota bacterium]